MEEGFERYDARALANDRGKLISRIVQERRSRDSLSIRNRILQRMLVLTATGVLEYNKECRVVVDPERTTDSKTQSSKPL